MGDFKYLYTLPTGDDVVTMTPDDDGGFSVCTNTEAIGNFQSLSEAVQGSVMFLRGRGRYDDGFLKYALKLEGWDRGLMDTFDPEASE